MGKKGEKHPSREPTYASYPDKGCEFSELCVTCLLPECYFEMPPKEQHKWRKKRGNEVESDIELQADGYGV